MSVIAWGGTKHTSRNIRNIYWFINRICTIDLKCSNEDNKFKDRHKLL